VCRNLTRITAAVCMKCLKDSANGFAVKPDPGMVELLYKAASHPSVNISAIALDVLCELGSKGYTGTEAMLPVLQRKAIIPHHVLPSGYLSLAAYETSGVTFHDFVTYRDTILARFLCLCWRANGIDYMESCTAAVEEFCSDRPSPELSLQLEAALFCIETMADQIQLSQRDSASYSEQLKRCMAAFSSKPKVLMANSLAVSRMCRLLEQVRQ